jgi:hypothetical protein
MIVVSVYRPGGHSGRADLRREQCGISQRLNWIVDIVSASDTVEDRERY